MFKIFFCGVEKRWLCVGLLLFALADNSANAHEFWIEPTNYAVEKNAEIEAFLRNGERFKGSSVSYLKSSTIRFEVLSQGREDPVVARLGDNPALKMSAVAGGLNVVVHQKKASVISYRSWEKFQRFAEHKNFPNVRLRHQERALPDKDFREAYSRYSKSLVAVGDGKGSDRQAGLEIELVALQNPYTEDVSEGLGILAYYQNRVRPNAQIELFEKSAAGEVTVSLHRTDDHGKVVLPVKSAHSYLVDMVVLREPAKTLAKSRNVVWETLWASLTFAVR